MTELETAADLRQKIPFLRGYKLTRDLRGHSRALCYVLQKPQQKFFMKIYTGERVAKLKYINSLYRLLQVPTAEIIEVGYLPDSDQTFCIYEYIDGETVGEMARKASLEELADIGRKVGLEIRKFATLKGNASAFRESLDFELNELLQNTRAQKQLYEQTNLEKLPEVDLDRLEKSLHSLKTAVYATEPVFVHSDINLNNIILRDGKPVLIDTEGGKIKFRALDFRGNCWWGWSGDNVEREQAIYRGIYQGLFDNNIPDNFHQELSFTMIYEFLLRNRRYENDLEQIHYSFLRWHDNLEQTNYFENYRFSWF